jgi:uncharacterized protein (DUF1697 family)
MTYVALLRGINVGGKNKLPMRDLVEIFESAKCQTVRTYIQSGNVIFQVPAAILVQLPELIISRIREEFGFTSPVILRSAKQLEQICLLNPFVRPDREDEGLHVMFLAHAPSGAQIAGLDPMRSPGDEFAVRGSEIYLRLPKGVAASKLTNNYFDSKLATISTARNWQTVMKLAELTRD